MGVDPRLERVVLAELSRWRRHSRRRAPRQPVQRTPGRQSAERGPLRAEAAAKLAVLPLGYHRVGDDRAALAGGA